MNKRIAYITDIHLNEQLIIDQGIDAWKNLEDVFADVRRRKFDEIVFGGDIGDSSAYEQFFRMADQLSLPYRITPGNHDKPVDLAAYYPHAQLAEEKLYSVDTHASHRFIFMDSSADRVDSTQLYWLEQQLQTDQPVILFIHHPVLGVNTPLDSMYPLHERDEVKQVLVNSGRSIELFCGHYHMPDEQSEGNITQRISPATAFQIKKHAPGFEIDLSRFGYRIISIEHEKVSSEVVWVKE